MITAPSPLRGATRTYRLGLGLALVGLLLTAGVLIAVSAVLSVRTAPAHEIAALGQHLAVPAANAQAVVLLLLATLGVSVVLAGAYGAIVVVSAARRLRRELPVLDRLPGHRHVWVILGDHPNAFCAGLLSPAVFISTAAVQQLSEEQLEAVLAHEHLHRMRRDPLRIASARVLASALFFLPVLRRLTERYCSLAELAADERALARFDGDTAPLAGAMLTFAQRERRPRAAGGGDADVRRARDRARARGSHVRAHAGLGAADRGHGPEPPRAERPRAARVAARPPRASADDAHVPAGVGAALHHHAGRDPAGRRRARRLDGPARLLRAAHRRRR